MIQLRDLNSLSILSHALNEQIENIAYVNFPESVICTTKNNYIIIEDSADDDTFLIQKFKSKSSYENKEPCQTLKISKNKIERSLEIFPKGRVLASIYGKKVTKIEKIDPKRTPELFFLAQLLHDCVNIHFDDGSGETINLYSLSHKAKTWAAKAGFSITSGTGVTYSVIKVTNDQDKEIGVFSNEKEHFAVFSAVNKIDAIIKINNKTEKRDDRNG